MLSLADQHDTALQLRRRADEPCELERLLRVLHEQRGALHRLLVLLDLEPDAGLVGTVFGLVAWRALVIDILLRDQRRDRQRRRQGNDQDTSTHGLGLVGIGRDVSEERCDGRMRTLRIAQLAAPRTDDIEPDEIATAQVDQ